MRVNSFKYSEEKINKSFKKRIDELILTMPNSVKSKNAENLLEAQTIVLPQIPNENKTREIANTLNHIESLCLELDFYEREKRKQYYVDLIEALSDEIDEEKIDIEDLKDRILFGNSFNNTAFLLERKQKYESLLKTGQYKSNFSYKKNSYQKKDNKNSNNSKVLGVKRRKMINSSGIKIINSLYSLSSFSLTKKKNVNSNFSYNNNNNKSRLNDKKDESDFFNLNETNNSCNNYNNTILNNDKNISPAKQGNYKKQKLVKRGSTCNTKSVDQENNFSFDAAFNPSLIRNKINSNENFINTNTASISSSINTRCFKCFNLINLDNISTCSICNANYHSYCENIKLVKTVKDALQIQSQSEGESQFEEKRICNYCIYVTQQYNNESEIKMSNNISNIINSNSDYENVDVSSPLIESQIPNIKYKCQRLEDGIIKFNSQYGINNYLFLKYSRELAKEYYLKNAKN
jgi:hypothetical protein